MVQEFSGNHEHIDTAIRRHISDAMRRSSKSRAEIAEEMSRRLECRVTASMLNDYTAETKGAARFPAAWIVALCEVTGDDRLQRLVLSARLQKLLGLAERELNNIRAEREKIALREELLGGQ
jgi:hypothetical protein